MSGGVVIVLAAGRGRRMGGPKALMRVRGRAWWGWQAERLALCGRESVWVVSEEVERAIGADPDARATPASQTRHPLRKPGGGACERVRADSDAPMMASVLAGIGAVRVRRPRVVFVLPVDVPCAGRGVFDALERAAAGVSVPRYRGTRGHPVALAWGWIERRLVGAAADARLDALIGSDATIVDVDDPGVAVNLNTPDELRAFEARL